MLLCKTLTPWVAAPIPPHHTIACAQGAVAGLGGRQVNVHQQHVVVKDADPMGGPIP